ncbi:MAG: U32 family peptidase C-terminal domain-containing protein, partial [Candidatus Parcubacteria bacterium]|nr:U32 family peptidase C-terminal domain-containing protein [Candidatus Parcubacteria bacterium]
LANVVKIYKNAMRIYESKANLRIREKKIRELYEELHKISNREFTTGFYFGTEKFKMQKYDAPYVRPDLEFCGEVLERKEMVKGVWQYKVKVHNVIKIGDQIEFILPQKENFKMPIPTIYDLDKKEYVAEVHGGQDKAILLQLNKEMPVMTILRKKLEIGNKK